MSRRYNTLGFFVPNRRYAATNDAVRGVCRYRSSQTNSAYDPITIKGNAMSTISPVSSNLPPPQVVQNPEAFETTAGPGHDGDADDHGATVKPTTNTSGQPIGLLVNAKA